MVKKKNNNLKSKDSKSYAFIATFFSIIGFLIAILAWRDDKYVMFYAKQSLIIFIIAIVISIINSILLFIPIIGWGIGLVLNIAVLLLWLVSWINALSGEEKTLIFVNSFSEKIKL